MYFLAEIFCSKNRKHYLCAIKVPNSKKYLIMTNSSEIQKTVGKQLAELRKASGLTQRELAEKCGVNYASIAKIESGTYNCSIVVLEKIAKCLNSSIELKAKKQLYTVAWRGHMGGSMRKNLIIGSESAKFSTLDEAIAFAEAELKDDPEVTAVDDFEDAMIEDGMQPLSESDIYNMGDNLEVYEHIFDEDGEEEDLVIKWQSDNYIVRDYDIYDSIIK